MAMPNAARAWTLDELHRLPDDGNKYELVEGALFLTPVPNEDHETILARLSGLLVPYVAANALGTVYHPRAVVRIGAPRSNRISWFARSECGQRSRGRRLRF